MIKRHIVFDIECDCCGRSLLGDEIAGYEIISYDDWDLLWQPFDEQYWVGSHGKHYCPHCYEYDDEDNIVIRNHSVCMELWEWLQDDTDGDWERVELYRFLDTRHGRAINVYVDYIKFYEDVRSVVFSEHEIPFTKQILFEIIKK